MPVIYTEQKAVHIIWRKIITGDMIYEYFSYYA